MIGIITLQLLERCLQPDVEDELSFRLFWHVPNYLLSALILVNRIYFQRGFDGVKISRRLADLGFCLILISV